MGATTYARYRPGDVVKSVLTMGRTGKRRLTVRYWTDLPEEVYVNAKGRPSPSTTGGWIFVGSPSKGWIDGKPPRIDEHYRSSGTCTWFHVNNVIAVPRPSEVEYL